MNAHLLSWPVGATWVVSALLIGCQLDPTLQAGRDAGPAGRLGGGSIDSDGSLPIDAARPPTARFTSRLGPGISPWADALAGVTAPATLGDALGTGTWFDPTGPDLVVGGRAYFDDGSSLVALDLATGVQLWLGPRLQSGMMTTDGETICGVLAETINATETGLVCVSAADGSETLRLFVAQQIRGFWPFASRTVELELASGRLLARIGGTFHLIDVAANAVLTEHSSVSPWRSFVLVGDDLLVVNDRSIAVLVPTTGGSRTVHSLAAPPYFLFEESPGVVLFTFDDSGTTSVMRYRSDTDALGLAPEWDTAFVGYSAVGGIAGPQGGMAWIHAGSSIAAIDVATRTPVAAFTAPGTIDSVRIHSDSVFLAASGMIHPYSRSGPGAPDAAWHVESWSFAPGGAWHDLP